MEEKQLCSIQTEKPCLFKRQLQMPKLLRSALDLVMPNWELPSADGYHLPTLLSCWSARLHQPVKYRHWQIKLEPAWVKTEYSCQLSTLLK